MDRIAAEPFHMGGELHDPAMFGRADPRNSFSTLLPSDYQDCKLAKRKAVPQSGMGLSLPKDAQGSVATKKKKLRLRGEELLRSLRAHPVFREHHELFDPSLDDRGRKKLMQKIRNRISAQESRDRKKNQFNGLMGDNITLMQNSLQLEKRLEEVVAENEKLRSLTRPDRELISQVRDILKDNIDIEYPSHRRSKKSGDWKAFSVFMMALTLLSVLHPDPRMLNEQLSMKSESGTSLGGLSTSFENITKDTVYKIEGLCNKFGLVSGLPLKFDFASKLFGANGSPGSPATFEPNGVVHAAYGSSSGSSVDADDLAASYLVDLTPKEPLSKNIQGLAAVEELMLGSSALKPKKMDTDLTMHIQPDLEERGASRSLEEDLSTAEESGNMAINLDIAKIATLVKYQFEANGSNEYEDDCDNDEDSESEGLTNYESSESESDEIVPQSKHSSSKQAASKKQPKQPCINATKAAGARRASLNRRSEIVA